MCFLPLAILSIVNKCSVSSLKEWSFFQFCGVLTSTLYKGSAETRRVSLEYRAIFSVAEIRDQRAVYSL